MCVSICVCVCEEGRVEASEALCVPNTKPITHLTHLDSVFLLLFVCFSVTSSSSSYNPPNGLLSFSRQRKTPPHSTLTFLCRVIFCRKKSADRTRFSWNSNKKWSFWTTFSWNGFFSLSAALAFSSEAEAVQFEDCCNGGSLSWSHSVPSPPKHV